VRVPAPAREPDGPAGGVVGAPDLGPPPGKFAMAVPGIGVLHKPGVGGVGRPSSVNRPVANPGLLFAKGRDDIVGKRDEPIVLYPITFFRGS
jgi:hypothetical protein